MEVKGIDVSRYQKEIDWQKVKDSGVQFAIIRAGYGRELNQVDPFFEKNYAACKAVGLPVGAYWFSYATDPYGALKEAHTCLKVIKGKSFEYPVWFDQEYEIKGIKDLTDQQRTDLVRVFCAELEEQGYYTGLYCSRDWLQNWVIPDQLKALDIWVAAYGKTPGNVPLPYGVWQYSDEGEIPGIPEPVDLDIAYKDYPAIIRRAGLNKL